MFCGDGQAKHLELALVATELRLRFSILLTLRLTVKLFKVLDFVANGWGLSLL